MKNGVKHYARYGRKAYWVNPQRHFLRQKKSWLKKAGIDVDRLSPEERSRLMSKIRSVSMIELVARPYAETVVGVRLRGQPQNLIGNPDYANKTKKVAVFLHGCFWHQPCPLGCAGMPKSRQEFWEKKFRRNAERHNEVEAALQGLGYSVVTIWEHELKDIFKRRKGELVHV